MKFATLIASTEMGLMERRCFIFETESRFLAAIQSKKYFGLGVYTILGYILRYHIVENLAQTNFPFLSFFCHVTPSKVIDL